MIEEVIYGMRYFFFIFLVSVLAFSQANYALVPLKYKTGKTKAEIIFDTIIINYRNSISNI